jgi:hypothetical protein
MSTLNKVTSPEIDVEALGDGYTRADVEFEGVDHSGSSYEGLVYINNSDAGHDTDPTAENGYVGSYYVFGHGGCYGDQGHCDVAPRAPYDPRAPHGLSPMRKVVVSTDAIRKATKSGSKLTVTVVPRILSTTDKVSENEVLPNFQAVSVITYQ